MCNFTSFTNDVVVVAYILLFINVFTILLTFQKIIDQLDQKEIKKKKKNVANECMLFFFVIEPGAAEHEVLSDV